MECFLAVITGNINESQVKIVSINQIAHGSSMLMCYLGIIWYGRRCTIIPHFKGTVIFYSFLTPRHPKNMKASLDRKNILLGVCGSIAAYKTAMLCRLLVKAGANVQVVMTQAATSFITPLTLSTLSKRKVITQFADSETAVWNNHVDLGLWADAMVIAPATGNTLAKLANGLCDDVLGASYLSARCPVFFAPAMDLDMWQHPATQANIQKLQSYKNQIIPVGVGELASGLSGPGRMAEPEDIVTYLAQFFRQQIHKQPFKGMSVLITAGPTYEAIDPVRFIGNRSSGKMGIALAEAAKEYGAEVELILGPTHLRPQVAGINVTPVQSAGEMFEATVPKFAKADIAILAAAVADFTPMQTSTSKIKKKGDDEGLNIPLGRTKDILATLGKQKQSHQKLIGFALETDNEVSNAKGKLTRKNLDFIVLNSLKDKGAGFKHNTNKITILDKYDNQQAYELKSKAEVARDILNYLVGLMMKT